MNNFNPLKVAMVFTIVGTIIGGIITTIVGTMDRFSRLEGQVETLLTNDQTIKEEREVSLNKINIEKQKMQGEIIALAQEEFKQVSENLASVQQATSDFQNRISNTEGKFNAITQTVQATKNDITQAQQDIKDINSQRNKALANILAAKRTISQLQNRVSSAEKKFNALNRALYVTKKEIAKAKAQQKVRLNAIEKKIAQDQSEIQRLNSEMKKTVKIRYRDNGDGTVVDNRTGLIWLKNANCFGRHIWKNAMQKAANLKSGQCGLSDNSRAGNWRLPTKKEWKAMLDNRYKNPAISNAAGTDKWKENDAFSGVQTNYYWWSSTAADNTSLAWGVYLHHGNISVGLKTLTLYVWPVRGGV